MSGTNGTLERPESALEQAGKIGGASGWSAWRVNSVSWKWAAWDGGSATGGREDDRAAAIAAAESALDELVRRRLGGEE